MAKIVSKKKKEAICKERYNKSIAKPQHGVFFRQMKENDIDVKTTMSWMGNCHLSPQSETYICGAQELAIFTSWHKKNIVDCMVARFVTKKAKQLLIFLLAVIPWQKKNTWITTTLQNISIMSYTKPLDSKLRVNGI